MKPVDKYENYSLEDFVWDEVFRAWVLLPNPSLTDFWNNWLQLNPEKKILLQQASEVVKSLTVSREKLSDQKKQEIINKTLAKMDNSILVQQSPVLNRNYLKPAWKRSYRFFNVGIAAVLLMLVISVWLLVSKNNNSDTDFTYKALVKQSRTALVETYNTSSIPLLVQLSDGSSVKLDKGARISYTPSFSNLDKREVYLSGTAFFKITKNPYKPFIVHADGVITKVLGTSFKVKTDIESRKVIVEVITGRVEVYEQKYSTVNSKSSKENGVILTPNQKVVYSSDKKLFEPSLVDEPVPIERTDKKIVKEDFVFEEVPLSKVIAAIESIYGIEVEVENKAILNCPFTGDISEQNLYRKFDAICLTTKTTYEIKETKIIIKGLGCY